MCLQFEIMGKRVFLYIRFFMAYFNKVLGSFIVAFFAKSIMTMGSSTYPHNFSKNKYDYSKEFKHELSNFLASNDFKEAFNYIKHSKISHKDFALNLLKHGTCVHVASCFGLEDSLKNLYKLGHYKKSQDSRYGWTPLHIACHKGNLSMVSTILEHDKDAANISNYEGESCLHIACDANCYEIVKLLVEAGADVNAIESRYGNTPLHISAKKGSSEIIKYLLLNNAYTNIINKEDCCALDMALKHYHNSAAESILYYNGCCVHLTRSGYGDTNDIYKYLGTSRVVSELIQGILFANGKEFYKKLNNKTKAALTSQGRSGISPLMWSVCRNNCKILKKILKSIKQSNQSEAKNKKYNTGDILHFNKYGENVLNIAYTRNLTKIHNILYKFLEPERKGLEAYIKLWINRIKKNDENLKDLSIPADVFEDVVMEYIHGPRPTDVFEDVVMEHIHGPRPIS